MVGCVLCIIAWCVWLIGYPIYVKQKRKYFDGAMYVLIMNVLAVAVSIANLLSKL